MGEAFITRRGGGGIGKLFAAIGVEYPAGSECTCSNGTKTLKAKDTSGKWVFAIPEAGTWTVTATDGTNSKSVDVEISEQGQIVSIELAYWNGELYDTGNEFETYTGGWSVGTNGGWGASAEKGNVDMWIGSSATNATAVSYAETNEEVDATGYSKLNVKVSEAVGTSHKIYFGDATVGTFGAATKETTWTTNLGSATKGVVRIENTGYSGGSTSITIIKVWLS